MLERGIINSQLVALMAKLRHTDTFVIGDSGLPVPAGVPEVDLAVVFGLPRFRNVLDAIMSEVVSEGAIIATEARGSQVEDWVRQAMGGEDVVDVPHDGPDGFKAAMASASFVVRTGETTPYANVIIRAGVPF